MQAPCLCLSIAAEPRARLQDSIFGQLKDSSHFEDLLLTLARLQDGGNKSNDSLAAAGNNEEEIIKKPLRKKKKEKKKKSTIMSKA